jgi:hypothetical protein
MIIYTFAINEGYEYIDQIYIFAKQSGGGANSPPWSRCLCNENEGNI